MDKPRKGRPPKVRNTAENPVATEGAPEVLDDYMASRCRVIGENIRNERRVRDFSIENLAEYLELSSSYIGLLERGERCPSLKSLFKVCDLFGCEPDDILTNKRDMTTQGRLTVAETRRNAQQNKYNAAISLLAGLDEGQLDVIIGLAKSLKQLKKHMLKEQMTGGEE